MRNFYNLGFGLLMAVFITSASAAEYPSRPITFLTMTQPARSWGSLLMSRT